MAEPIDSAFSLLSNAGDLIREQYRMGFEPQTFRFGSASNKIFAPSKRTIQGDGFTIQVKTRHAHSSNSDRNAMGEFPNPRGFGTGKYKPIFQEDGTNHFSIIRTSGRVTYWDLERKATAKVAAVDVATDIIEEQLAEQDELLAILRNLRADAKTGVVEGTPKKNDDETYAGASATPAASTGARIVIEAGTGPIAIYQPGRRFDVYDASTGAKNGTVEVSDYNPADRSVGIYAVDSDGVRQTATSVATSIIDDNDILYMVGMKDAGMYSLGEWFADPASTGDDFFGKDRATPDNRWLRPTVTGPSSATTLAMSHINNMSQALHHIAEADISYITQMQPELEQQFRDEVGEDILVDFPSTQQRGKLIAQYGFVGSIYRSPKMGTVSLETDALAAEREIKFLRIGDWEQLMALSGGMQMLPGDGGGVWYREQAAAPNTGKGLTYRNDAIGAYCDICTAPRLQAKIKNVKAA